MITNVKARPLMTSYLKNLEEKEQNGWLRKLLPFLLLLSFAWVELFPEFSYAGTLGLGLSGENFEFVFFGDLLVYSCMSWVLFEILFYLYRLILSFSIFGYSIPKIYFQNRARLFVVYRNIIMGAVNSLCFFFPSIIAFIELLTLVINFIVFTFFALHVVKERVHDTVKANVFKSLFTPYLILEGLNIIILIVGVV